MGLVSKVREGLKYHLVDSTALLAESTPLFAASETGIAGMSDDISLNARLFVAGITFLGAGYVFAKGRDMSRKFWKITQQSREKIQSLHDSLYLAAVNLTVSVPIYLASGAEDPKEIAVGAGTAAGFGIVNGAPLGYSVDVFRDLTGLMGCNRKSYPKFIKDRGPGVKKGLAALLATGSAATTAGVYHLINN